MKLLILSIVLLISGCSTTAPVVQKFPDAPVGLLEECPKLETVPNDEKSIVEFVKIVINNYELYHECSEKNQTWIKWYKGQKELFNK